MSTEVLPETQRHPRASRGQRRSDGQDSSPGRWWRRGLLAIGAVTLVASAAALIRGAISSRQIGPKLTHTITRGDLIVSVTEQGTLESSDNTEIKCKVRGAEIPILWVIESGTEVKPGDELVRLEALAFEDRFHEMSKYAHLTRSGAERARANVARAELAISEYLEGRYHSQLLTLEKDLAVAESSLRTAQNMLSHAEMMAERGYVSELDVEEKTFAVTQARLNLEIKKTEIDVLKNFTKAMEIETLKGNLKASKATLEAEEERVRVLEAQVALSLKDIEHCVVKAERSGLVIYPAAEPWKYVPEIEEGATVYMGQTLLLMPDLSKMQVKVGIRESVIDRIKPGLAAGVTLPDRRLDGQVSSVASVTAPAGWSTGEVAKYETIIKLPSVPGLKPGMSAEVEVIIDRHEDVLTIPVAAVVETTEGDFCWVKTAQGAKRRSLRLGDTNEVFTVVKAGLKEGDEVVLNPLAFIEQAQLEVLKPLDKAEPREPGSPEFRTESKPGPTATKPSTDSKKQKSKPRGAKPRRGNQASAGSHTEMIR